MRILERNRGKGGAVKTGLGAARGDVVLIRDLDHPQVEVPEVLTARP